MAAQPVEWVLVVYYGPEAHHATYGREVRSPRYSKDFIQLSRRPDFVETLNHLFPESATGNRVELTYRWPAATAPGAFNFSSDRWHLKWETRNGAPAPWKMLLHPSEATAETIPGNPSHLDFGAAENELALLATRGAGQPYLIAVKLRDEPNTLHLRAYLANPRKKYAWANIRLTPLKVRELALKTSQSRATAWSTFRSGGVAPITLVDDALSRVIRNPSGGVDTLNADAGRALASYLRQPGYGLFFDPARNHDAWTEAAPSTANAAASIHAILPLIEARFPPLPATDAAAETSEPDAAEVEAFRRQIQSKSFEVPDSTATVKTRGSAQRAFADAVKSNYGMQCAITGIRTKEFLVAAHIVPWSVDQSIRLDPTNGICLSLLADRAFEAGYLLIDDDMTVRVDWAKVGNDDALRSVLKQYDEMKLNAPAAGGPRVLYLQRRRTLIASPG